MQRERLGHNKTERKETLLRGEVFYCKVDYVVCWISEQLDKLLMDNSHHSFSPQLLVILKAEMGDLRKVEFLRRAALEDVQYVLASCFEMRRRVI